MNNRSKICTNQKKLLPCIRKLYHSMRKSIFAFLLGLYFMPTQAQTKQDTIYGNASYYSSKMNGRRTASGERFHNDSMMCAHKTYPFGTRLLVRNLSNGKEVIVRVTDRGPYTKKYVLDLSQAAAKALGFLRQGYTPVQISVVKDLNVPFKSEDDDFTLPALTLGEENDSLYYEPEWQATDSLPESVPHKNAGIARKRPSKTLSTTPKKTTSQKKRTSAKKKTRRRK